MFHPGCGLLRLAEGGAVVDRLGIKDDQIGEPTFAHHAPLLQTETLRRESTQLVNSLFQCQELVVAHPRAKDTRGRSILARVDHTVGLIDAVGADHVAWVLDEGRNRFVLSPVKDQQHRQILLSHQVEQRLRRRQFHRFDVLSQRLALIDRVGLAQHPGDVDGVEVIAGVLQGMDTAGAHARVVQLLNHAEGAIAPNFIRQQEIEHGRAGHIRIDVKREGNFLARLLDESHNLIRFAWRPRFEVRNVDRHAGTLSNRQRLA